MFIALHFSTTISDPEVIKELVLKPAAKWYCEYIKWEDKNILDGYTEE